MFTKIGLVCLGFLFLAVSLSALPPPDHDPSQNASENRSLDMLTYIDANLLLMYATNQGGLAEDWAMVNGRADGLYFPYQGTCMTLSYDPHHVLYSAGLILGGKVDGQIRLAIGAFDTPEYVQGPMDQYGDPMPDDPRFKMYKITSDSSVWLDPSKPDCARDDSMYHFDDYILWQTPAVLADGAPLDEYGNPLLMGTRTLWTVFNDGGDHTYTSYGGGTLPLGIEVQELIWASNAPEEENEIYIQYLLINKGGNTIEDFYVSFWVDPDLGGASDDLVGCDSVHGIFFCYNATDNDNLYGSTPPAWGGQFLYGLVVPSPGDSAYFNGEWRQGYRNLGMTSFNKYINGTDPDVPEQMYGYMQGFDAMNCPTCPYINPGTGLTTRFPFSGNPNNGTGWLDSNPADRRLMANCGPITFNPGDTQQVLFKIAAARGANRLESLCNLLDILDSACTGPTNYVPIYDMTTYIDDEGGLKNVYFSGDPRWISWVTWGADFFGGSSDYGWNFWGGYLNPATMPDSFASVEIQFTDNDPAAGQRAYSYCRGCSPNYSYLDYVQVPFQVWDTDNNRQLNACFIEWIDSDVFDGTWGPDTTAVGGREYLLILRSDYDGDDPSDAGTGSLNYPAMDFYDGRDFDFLYGGWYRVRSGYTLGDMEVGHKMVFYYKPQINFDPYADSILFGEVGVGDSTYQNLRITAYSYSLSTVNISVSDSANFSVSPQSFVFIVEGTETVQIDFHPTENGEHVTYLHIIDGFNGNHLGIMRLIGSASGGPDIVTMFIEPDPIYVMYKYTVGDTMTVEIYLPDNSVDYSIFDIDLSSVTVNGLVPDEVLIGNDGALGDYLKASINMIAFIDSYPLLWDTTEQVYAVSGQLYDETPIEELGTVTVIGHRAGDINLDDRVNILDVTYLISFMWMGGPEPLPVVEAGDMNGDGSYNILDITYLIRYIYVNGPPPIPPVL